MISDVYFPEIDWSVFVIASGENLDWMCCEVQMRWLCVVSLSQRNKEDLQVTTVQRVEIDLVMEHDIAYFLDIKIIHLMKNDVDY